MSVVNDPVEYGVGDGGITDGFVPFFDWQLAGDESGAGAVSVFDDFEEVSSFRVSHGGQSKVVQD